MTIETQLKYGYIGRSSEQYSEEESLLACIQMIGYTYECSLKANELRSIYLNYKNENQEELISMICDEIKFSSRAVKLTRNSINEVSTPCLVQKNDGSFIILDSVSVTGLIVIDPFNGKETIPIQIMFDYLTSFGIELRPKLDFSDEKEDKDTIKLSTFWSKSVGIKKTIFKIFILSIFIQIFILSTPLLMQLVIDDVLVSSDLDLLLLLTIAFFIILVFQLICTGIRSLIISLFGTKLSVHMSSSLISHLFKLPMEYFESRHMGDIISRTNSLEQIRKLFTTTIVEGLVDGVMSIGLLMVMLFYSMHLTFLVLAFAVVYLLFRVVLYPHLRKAQKRLIVSRASKNSNLMESIRNIQSVKLYCKESNRLSLFDELNVLMSNDAIRLDKQNILFSLIKSAISGTQNIVVIYLSVHLVLNGDFSVGMIVAFLAYKNQFDNRVLNLIDKYMDFKIVSLHLNRLSDIAKTDEESFLGQRDLKHKIQGKLEIHNTNFRYPESNADIFSNLNLVVKEGESIAITGPSGCGKTTLLKVMLGLLRPSIGEIIVDGKNIRDIGLHNYRSQIGSVMQNENLLSGTLYDNISFFDTRPDYDFIEKCAKLAGIHDDIIATSNKYNTKINDMGVTLSSGQIQRIILARALYRRPKILFLDEATSNLDNHTESYVVESISDLNITRIFIAHREHSINSADRVIHFQDGVFTEI